jgi:hypothetical protein
MTTITLIAENTSRMTGVSRWSSAAPIRGRPTRSITFSTALWNMIRTERLVPWVRTSCCWVGETRAAVPCLLAPDDDEIRSVNLQMSNFGHWLMNRPGF